LPSCEAVLASSTQELDMTASRAAPDLSRDALAGVLENGAYLAACAIPDTTALDVCVAVQEGRVKGASVVSRPADPAINACVKRAVASLRFPYSARFDVTRTRFEALPKAR
jgi:hypothetical protein